MKRKLKQFLPYTIPYAVLAIGVGWAALVFLLMPDADWKTASLYLMPFPLVLVPQMPMALVSMRDTNGNIDFLSHLEIWCVFVCTLVASYVSSFLPPSILEATILSIMLSVVLWLALVQATRRRFYQALTRRKIARRLGVSEDHSDVRRLANNQDLPQALVAGILVTVQVWLLTSSDAFVDWLPLVFGTPQTFSPGAARTTGFFVGWAIGMLYYRYCPNQTEIRELASDLTEHQRQK